MTRQNNELGWFLIAWWLVLAAVSIGVGVGLSAVLYGDADVVGHRPMLALTCVLVAVAEVTSVRTLAWVLSRWRR